MEKICPYCRAPIQSLEVPECPGCHVPHHLECWLENQGCSVPGCSEAPEDEGKIIVSGASLHRSQAISSPSFEPPPLAYQTIHPPPFLRETKAKSRIAFMLLGAFLGPLGCHNFYAGYVGNGTAQLLVSLLTLGWGAVVTWPWAIIEICIIYHDSDKNLMD